MNKSTAFQDSELTYLRGALKSAAEELEHFRKENKRLEEELRVWVGNAKLYDKKRMEAEELVRKYRETFDIL